MALDNLKQRAMHGVMWHGGSRLVIQGITWIITLVVARLLTPEDYGLLGFALLAMTVIDSLSEFGLGTAIMQKQEADSLDLNTAFWSALAVNLVIVALLWFAAPFLALFFGQPKITPIIRVISLTYIISALRIVPFSLLSKEIKFKQRSIAEAIATIAGGVTTLAFAYGGAKVWALVLGMLLRQCALTLLSFYFHPWFPRFQFAVLRLRQLAAYGATLSVSGVFWQFYSNADYFFVGKCLGQSALGFYTMAFQFSMKVADRFTVVINNVGFPVYNKIQSDPQRVKRGYLRTVTLTAVVACPILTGFFLVADDGIPLVLTEKWSSIIVPFKIMCWPGLIMALSSLLAPLLNSKGRPDLNLKFTAVCCVIMPLGFWAGTRSGLAGVCWAWAILYPIVVAGFYVRIRSVLDHSWEELWIALKPALLSTGVMLAGVLLLKALLPPTVSHIDLLTCVVIAGTLSYLMCLKWRFPAVVLEMRNLIRNQTQSRECAE